MIILVVSRVCKEGKVDFSTASLTVPPIAERLVIESDQEVRIRVGVTMLGARVRAMVRVKG